MCLILCSCKTGSHEANDETLREGRDGVIIISVFCARNSFLGFSGFLHGIYG